MCDALFGGGGNSDAAEAARRDEEARQARIRAGMGQIDQTFSQFNDDYFDTRSKAYLDYATPQLEDQFAKAKEQLIFALSRGGNLNRSEEHKSELQSLMRISYAVCCLKKKKEK